ncbi:MAG: tripartite tricarboxylate transporter substrate binding protein [Betaproteobacteria bacterium]|nr:tripartite tricarboxylate transporter substrate binding protein [Betaproteobacteria bacterium]
MKLASAIAFCAVAALISGAAYSQAFPNKAVRIVVAYPPGGTTDITARVLAKALNAKWGNPVIVENRPCIGMIGAEAVVKSAPDGYTLLVGYTPEVSLNKLFFRNMSYDPDRDLLPITLLTSSPLVLAVHPSVGVKSVGELIALAKSNPGSVNYASPGIGGQQHLAGESLALATKTKLMHVPYKGTGPATTDLLGGQVQMMFASIAPLLPHLRAGKLVPVGIADTRRSPLLPDVLRSSSPGSPGFEFVNWLGLFAPAGTSMAVAEQLNRDVIVVMRQDDTKHAPAQGLDVALASLKEFADFIKEEMAKYSRITREANVKIEQQERMPHHEPRRRAKWPVWKTTGANVATGCGTNRPCGSRMECCGWPAP